MKNLIRIFLLILLGLGSTSSFSQSPQLELDCPENIIEIGDTTSISVSITNTGTLDSVNSYTWSASGLGVGISSSGDLEGSIGDQTTNDDIFTNSVDSTNFVWGDWSDPCYDIIDVTANYVDTSGVSHTIKTSCNVKIGCLEFPSISGPESIPYCCRDLVTFSESSNYIDDGYTWIWVVSGGTIVEGDSTSIISVEPSDDNYLTVTCTVYRSAGSESYSKSSNITVFRSGRKTPKISGGGPICQGQTAELCVSNICGSIGANWSVGSGLTIISGNGSNCITVEASNSAPDGTVVNVHANSIMEGGCKTSTSGTSMTIYSYETPPPPSGYPVLLLPDGWDPCSNENTYEIEFVTKTPYTNGITTITPGVIIDVPHHNLPPKISITVCNRNFCSGISTCTKYYIYLPEGCLDDEDPFPIHPLLSDDGSLEVVPIKLQYSDILVYPNPTGNEININSNVLISGQIFLFNIMGEIIVEKKVNSTIIRLNTSNIEKNGVYYLQIPTDDGLFMRKIIIQK